jgi:hypothetical protein
MYQWMLAALVVCGAMVFTSCSSDDNDSNIDNLSEKIIGKWMVTDLDGEPALTNMKRVVTFVSPTKAFISASLNLSESGPHWMDLLESDVVIDGNKMTLNHTDGNLAALEEYTVTAINDNEFTANQKITLMIDGNEVLSREQIVRFVKQTADYAQPVLGLWECEGLTGIETYNDANARLEFLADGTYRYYRQDDNGQWQVVTTRDFQDYFVDGTLLATRWKNNGEDELREWWEIESLNSSHMVWKALRQKEDGSISVQKVTWKRIDLKVAEKIIGKWLQTDMMGRPMPTNQRLVYTFVSDTKAYISTSLSGNETMASQWNDKAEADVTVNGNEMVLTSKRSENMTVVERFIITDITDNEFIATHEVTITTDGNVLPANSHTLRLTKIPTDYRADIVGTWQGHCTSAGSVFDDGQEHRWEYKADGTYVYYVKSGDNWVPYATNTLNEYFVDGNLLCTRWIDSGVENREWWEVSINGNKMNWTALRENPDRTTFTATFEMTKVE